MENIKDKIMDKRTTLAELLKSEYGYYSTDLMEKILSLMGENELGDSGVAGTHGDYTVVTSRTANGEVAETPVDGALPPKPEAKEDCPNCGSSDTNQTEEYWYECNQCDNEWTI